MMAATVQRSTGPKVNGWSYSHPYIRTASLWFYKPGLDIITDRPTIETSYNMSRITGLPNDNPTPVTALPTSNVGGPPTVPDQNTVNRLITECKIKIGRRQANYGESIAEGRKTVRSICASALTVLKAYKAIRSGNVNLFFKTLGLTKSHVGTLKTPADYWLAYQYGWKPLLSDIYDSHQLFTKGLGERNQHLSAVRVISQSGPYRRGAATGKITASYRCKLHYRLTDGWIADMSSLGLINPLEVAWAVVPFSFVVDWFIPVGNWLESISATLGMTFIDGCISSTHEISARLVLSSPISLGGYRQPGSTPFELCLEHFGLTRNVVLAAPSIPYTKSPFSSTHLVSALALIRSLSR